MPISRSDFTRVYVAIDPAATSGEDADDTALGSAVCFGRLDFDEDLVAVHGAADFVGGDEDVVCDSLFRIRSDESEAVAVEIEASGSEVLAGGSGAGQGPLISVELRETAAKGEPGQLFDEQASFSTTAESELANQLLVAGLCSRGTGDAGDEFAIGHKGRLNPEPGVTTGWPAIGVIVNKLRR